MNEYHIVIDKDKERMCMFNFYHDDFFTNEEIENILKSIYNECRETKPEVYHHKHFKYYIEHQLTTLYGFYRYSKRNIYEFKDIELKS